MAPELGLVTPVERDPLKSTPVERNPFNIQQVQDATRRRDRAQGGPISAQPEDISSPRRPINAHSLIVPAPTQDPQQRNQFDATVCFIRERKSINDFSGPFSLPITFSVELFIFLELSFYILQLKMRNVFHSWVILLISG